MNRRFWFALVSLLCFGAGSFNSASRDGACGVAAQAGPAVEARIQRVENGLLPPVTIKGEKVTTAKLADRMRFYKTPAVSIAVINDGAIEWARGYGVREDGTNQAVTPATRFQAASISKPVAAMAALRLVEDGKLVLDEDVNRKLTSWKVPDNEYTRQKPVTLRGLLSHSAGITVHGFPGYGSDEKVPTLLEILDGRKPANTAPIRVDILPGSQWRYSGGGFTIMQQLLLDATGRPFPELMEETALRKIGMNDSGYLQPLPQSLWSGAAVAYRADGQPVKGNWHTYPEMAAAGLWTTPSDLARFAIEIQQSLAGKSNKVLTREMTRQMLTIQKGNYGLGLGIDGEGKTARFSHGGSNEGYRCTLVAYNETGQGAAIMTDSDRGDQLMGEILRSIAREYGWPDYHPVEKVAASVDAATLDACVGEYELPRAGKITVTQKDGHLLLTMSPAFGLERAELYPESDTKFFATNTNLSVSFVKAASGAVTEMLIQPGGQTLTAKRVK